MQADRLLTFSFSILLVLQASMALAAITLFGRMAPAIEDIIEDNVVSVEAVESMLKAALDYRSGVDPRTARSTFEDAFAQARSNVTEEAEVPVLASIEQLAPVAFAGDETALRELGLRLRALGDINRSAMTAADQTAKRLGIAGAWSMVVLGIGGFVSGLLTLRRARRKLLMPIQEINSALRAAIAGDRLRRCTSDAPAAGDLEETMLMINRLLDRRLEEDCSTLRDSRV